MPDPEIVPPKVYIIILNWNGWKDTLECLESVFRSSYGNFVVVLCDNASSDGSLEKIKLWANGYLECECANPALAFACHPPVPKPVAFSELPLAEVDNAQASHSKLVLIQTGANLGFAGGNNAGIRYALAQADFEFVWLLNNDTVVRADALEQLVSRMTENPKAGLCGSTLLYYHDPERVQALGGSRLQAWSMRGGNIGKGAIFQEFPSPDAVEATLAFIIGASMMASRRFIEDVGLLAEEYFLYGEELDWIRRSNGKFKLAYAPASIVYHKEGRSIGTNRSTALQSELAEFYAARTRILLTRKFFPERLPTVLSAVCVSALHRLLRGRPGNFSALLKGTKSALLFRADSLNK